MRESGFTVSDNLTKHSIADPRPNSSNNHTMGFLELHMRQNQVEIKHYFVVYFDPRHRTSTMAGLIRAALTFLVFAHLQSTHESSPYYQVLCAGSASYTRNKYQKLHTLNIPDSNKPMVFSGITLYYENTYSMRPQ